MVTRSQNGQLTDRVLILCRDVDSLIPMTPRVVLKLTQYPFQRVLAASSIGIKQLELDAVHFHYQYPESGDGRGGLYPSTQGHYCKVIYYLYYYIHYIIIILLTYNRM
jgi:hypothetical protein